MPAAAQHRCAAAALLAVIVWQIQVVFTAYRFGKVFADLFAALGAQLPLPTQLFLASYKWWAAIPMIYALLLLDLRRGRPRPLWYLVVLIGSALGAAFVLATWSTEACFGPMFSLIKQVG